MIWVIAGTLDGRTLAVDVQERTGRGSRDCCEPIWGGTSCP